MLSFSLFLLNFDAVQCLQYCIIIQVSYLIRNEKKLQKWNLCANTMSSCDILVYHIHVLMQLAKNVENVIDGMLLQNILSNQYVRSAALMF